MTNIHVIVSVDILNCHAIVPSGLFTPGVTGPRFVQVVGTDSFALPFVRLTVSRPCGMQRPRVRFPPEKTFRIEVHTSV